MTSPASDQVIGVLMAEYDKVKSEQAARIGFRDNLIYAALTATAALATIVSTVGSVDLLLLAPFVATPLGWTYFANDLMISMMGRYIREDLAPRIQQLVGPDAAFGWEYLHKDDRGRRTRKRIQLAVDLITFVLPAVGAVITALVIGSRTPIAWFAAVAGMAALAVLTRQMIRYAER